LPQNSVNQRPTIFLLSSVDMMAVLSCGKVLVLCTLQDPVDLSWVAPAAPSRFRQDA
jgi:hypothetical protein